MSQFALRRFGFPKTLVGTGAYSREMNYATLRHAPAEKAEFWDYDLYNIGKQDGRAKRIFAMVGYVMGGGSGRCRSTRRLLTVGKGRVRWIFCRWGETRNEGGDSRLESIDSPLRHNRTLSCFHFPAVRIASQNDWALRTPWEDFAKLIPNRTRLHCWYVHVCQ